MTPPSSLDGTDSLAAYRAELEGKAKAANEAHRVVPLSLLVRAREHVPYLGETWKALTAVMTEKETK